MTDSSILSLELLQNSFQNQTDLQIQLTFMTFSLATAVLSGQIMPRSFQFKGKIR